MANTTIILPNGIVLSGRRGTRDAAIFERYLAATKPKVTKPLDYDPLDSESDGEPDNGYAMQD